MATVTIDGIMFTLYYNYDQIRDHKLSLLSDTGKVVWFHRRMELVFLEPLRRFIDPNSIAHKELNSSDDTDMPHRTAIIATFSLLLNGIEALGSFISSKSTSKRKAFLNFIQHYMPSLLPYRKFVRIWHDGRRIGW